MADDTLSDAQRQWDEGDTPSLSVTMLDGVGSPVPLSSVTTLTLTQWIEQPNGKPGLKINNRNLQDAKNANNNTVDSTSGLVTWQLQVEDTTMQSKDLSVVEEKHHFCFTLVYTATAGTLQKSYVDYYVVKRLTTVR